MKAYISPEVEINMFDVEDVITTSSFFDAVLKTVGLNVGEVSFSELNDDLTNENVDIFK